MWPFVLTFIVGLLFAVFGFLLLFRKGLVEKLRKGIWKVPEDSVFAGKEGYRLDKYGRGIQSLIVGLFLIGFVIYMLVKAYLGEISI